MHVGDAAGVVLAVTLRVGLVVSSGLCLVTGNEWNGRHKVRYSYVPVVVVDVEV